MRARWVLFRKGYQYSDLDLQLIVTNVTSTDMSVWSSGGKNKIIVSGSYYKRQYELEDMPQSPSVAFTTGLEPSALRRNVTGIPEDCHVPTEASMGIDILCKAHIPKPSHMNFFNAVSAISKKRGSSRQDILTTPSWHGQPGCAGWAQSNFRRSAGSAPYQQPTVLRRQCS